MTLPGDIYTRYLSYENKDQMKKDVCDRLPEKIDIGAVFSASPSKKNALSADAFKPVEKEIVIDIDMTDYNDMRTCCTEAAVCDRCWGFMTTAVKVVDNVLRSTIPTPPSNTCS
jgi:DNA primase small subunit